MRGSSSLVSVGILLGILASIAAQRVATEDLLKDSPLADFAAPGRERHDEGNGEENLADLLSDTETGILQTGSNVVNVDR
jgi:hypothetical protein